MLLRALETVPGQFGGRFKSLLPNDFSATITKRWMGRANDWRSFRPKNSASLHGCSALILRVFGFVEAMMGRRGAAALLAGLTSACASRGAEPYGGVFGPLAVSPDGDSIAFEVRIPHADPGRLPRRAIGLFNRRTGALRRIPAPDGENFGAPSFSPDGRSLVGVTNRSRTTPATGASVVDLHSLRHRPVIEVPEFGFVQANSIFTPDGSSLIYGLRPRMNTEIRMLRLGTGRTEVLLPAASGFRGIIALAVAGSGALLFDARGPADERDKAAVTTLGASHIDGLVWRLPFGGRPELFCPRDPNLLAALPSVLRGSVVRGVAASHDGNVVVTGGLSANAPLDRRGRLQSEVHRIEPDGSLTPLTHIRGRIGHVAISAAGEVVAFVNDPDRQNLFDVWVLDLRTGHVGSLNLLARVRSHPDFQRA